MVVHRSFPDLLGDARASKKTSADYFTDIDKADIIRDANKFYSKNGWINKYNESIPGADNKAFRLCVKNKELLPEYDAAIEVAYKLGMLKPNKDGKSNIWKNVTMSECLRMLVDATDGSFSERGFE